MRFASHFANGAWIGWGNEQPGWHPDKDSQAEEFKRDFDEWLGRAPLTEPRSPADTSDIRAEIEKVAVWVRSLKDEAKPDGVKAGFKWSVISAVGSIAGKGLLVKIGLATALAADLVSGGLVMGAVILGGRAYIKQEDVKRRNNRFDDVIRALDELRSGL